jgi:hypothetical protein
MDVREVLTLSDYLIELLGALAMGALDTAIACGAAWRSHIELQALSLAHQFDLGSKFGAAIYLHRGIGK